MNNQIENNYCLAYGEFMLFKDMFNNKLIIIKSPFNKGPLLIIIYIEIKNMFKLIYKIFKNSLNKRGFLFVAFSNSFVTNSI